MERGGCHESTVNVTIDVSTIDTGVAPRDTDPEERKLL